MQNASSKQQAKKIQTNKLLSADKSTTSLSPAHHEEKELSTNLTLCEAYTKHWTKLRRGETKRKKEFNLETWEKETSNTMILKKKSKNKKAEKYYTNEGTN